VLFWIGSESGAGAGAEAADWWSWSENMVVGLREITSILSDPGQAGVTQTSIKFLANSLTGLCKEVNR